MWLADQAAGGGNIWMTLAPFILMFAIFYFLLIRPQQKKQKQRGSMLNALKKGDKVVTVGGMHGTIAEITDDTVVLKVNDVTKLTFDRSSINNVSAKSETPSLEKS
ncbi:preprotein translocase subunit YajC [Cohnella sp. LGH]|uniref:Preprotein translocase subunit YajC n=1 Tax=Cohnella phaseoli TaxID=456490 RepID=A0A3D9KMI8_9BACL|nr:MULTISPECIES: preprotein translocase subunit YajC [Cohnella]QTH44054.1 preprotein translocase subunit YajC [Cohnella sp. LGH]RED87706.1 preprotein translocase subunit YajC [Cohnella phaseoli]